MNRVAEPQVVIASDALPRLAEHARQARWDAALLVSDANTQEVAGTALADELQAQGVRCEELVFAAREGLRAGPAEAEQVEERLAGGPVPVAIGSGVITDIVRYAAHRRGVDFLSMPTAASMDGYASSGAAMQIDGVKVTYPARAPVAIYADPAVVAAAPSMLTRAGLGDLLGKATARVDWLAAHLLYGEPYLRAAADRVLTPLAQAAAGVQQVLAGEPEAIRTLLEGLLQSGIAIAQAGSSRPASGCEHHASHFWDLLAARGRRPHHSHGLQVGYATGFAMRLQQFAFGGELSVPVAPVAPADPLGSAARQWLGEPTEEIQEAVADKGRFVEAPPASWPSDAGAWGRVREALAGELARFHPVQAALERAGFPLRAGYLDVDVEMLRATFRHATRLRARYTTVDFLEGQGRLEQAIEQLPA